MNLFPRTRKLVHFAINTLLTINVKSPGIQLIPQRMSCVQITRNYGNKFSIAPKKKKSSDPNTWIFASLMISFLINLRQTSLRQSQVFQLDPLREDVSDIPVTARQRVLSGAITEGITNILNGPELDSAVRDCQLEITQVRATPNLQLATIYWTVPGDMKGDQERIQIMLEKNTDYIRRLLPAYSSLARFPQLVFIKDNTVEYEAEMEHLFQWAKHADSSSENASESKES